MKKIFLYLLILSLVSPSLAFGWFSPGSCNWATAPILSMSPISAKDLRECISDLIDGIRENKDKIEGLKSSNDWKSIDDLKLQNTLRDIDLRLKKLEDNLDSLESELERIKSKVK